MGLDTNLKAGLRVLDVISGEIFIWTNWQNRESDQKHLGKRISEIKVDLGYWRKHPNLHGFIVNKFAAGVDECQPIELNSADLDAIIFAVKNRELPHTQGFFFGASPTDESAVLEQIEDDVRIFEDAKQWLADRPENEARSVIYQASW